MAHSSDKTLIASLGFSDKDKKDPLHDKICQFIANSPQEVMNRISKWDWKVNNAQMEYAIVKGSLQYKSVVGFVDVVVRGLRSEKGNTAQWLPERVVFEVKAGEVSINNVIRQINFYREFLHSFQWALVVAFPVTEVERDLLRKEGIFTFTLEQIGMCLPQEAPGLKF